MATRKSKRAPGRAARPKRKSARRSGAKTRARRKPPSRRPKAARRKATGKRTTGAQRTAARVAPPKVPSAIGLNTQHMDYSSHDMEGIKRFYTETLGFRQFEHDTSFNYLWVRTGPSSSLGFMPPMPGPPEEWQPPREPTLYLVVEDVDRAHRELVAKGVAFDQDPADMPWGHRVARLRDPEGRRVMLAQTSKR